MNFDHRKPWIDHVCIQNWNVKRTAEWRREWGKPVVNDELEYEGDILLAWGDITAQELTHRFWVTVTRGGYAGHGECYAHPEDRLWWAKGESCAAKVGSGCLSCARLSKPTLSMA